MMPLNVSLLGEVEGHMVFILPLTPSPPHTQKHSSHKNGIKNGECITAGSPLGDDQDVWQDYKLPSDRS